jgi:hypothetical protein
LSAIEAPRAGVHKASIVSGGVGGLGVADEVSWRTTSLVALQTFAPPSTHAFPHPSAHPLSRTSVVGLGESPSDVCIDLLWRHSVGLGNPADRGTCTRNALVSPDARLMPNGTAIALQ